MQATLTEPAPEVHLAALSRPPAPPVKASVEVRHIVLFLNEAVGETLLARMERTPEQVTLAETLSVLCRFEGGGPLAHPWNAKSVMDALNARNGQGYRLLGARVLPNHVHVLVEVGPAWPSGDPIHRWKTTSSPRRKGTPRPGLDRCGPDRLRPRALRLEQPRPDEFWADEDFEIILRTPGELEEARRLIDEITLPPWPPTPLEPPPEPEPDDEAQKPAADVPPQLPVRPQSANAGRRVSRGSPKKGRLGGWLQEVRECVGDLTVLYGAFFLMVWIVALLQEALGRWAQHR